MKRRFANAWGGALAGATLALLTACAAAPLDDGSGGDTSATYARASEALTRQGKFRRDAAPLDAPYAAQDLFQNFEKTAFLPERQLARFYPDALAARRLSRWESPIRYRLRGDGVRAVDRQRLAALADQLAGLTGLSIAAAAEGERANLEAFVLSPRARGQIDARERGKPYYAGSLLREWIRAVRLPCFALLETAAPNGGEIRSAAIYLKAEVEDPWRESCLIEEVAQSLGLLFDHADVRPSIFNDDQEFMALTEHDGRLLRLLYDPELRAGMTWVEARSVVRRRLFGPARPEGGAPEAAAPAL